MNKKFFIKITILSLIFIILLNTTYSFGAKELLTNNLQNEKYLNYISSIQLSETTKGKNVLNKATNVVDTVIEKQLGKKSIFKLFKKQNSKKISDPQLSLTETLVGISKIRLIGNFFRTLDIEPERLATVICNVTTDIDWSNPEILKTFVKQLTTAIINTTDLTNGLITKNDVNKMIEDMTNGKYYYPDSTDEVTYTNIQDIARLSNYGSISVESQGKPISIGKVYLHNTDLEDLYGPNGKEIYMVALNGTGFVEGQQYGLLADLLSGMETDSQYLQYTLKAVLENIPEGSSLLIAGMSLGGMIAQQVMVQDCILQNYKVEYVTIIGSPALCVEERISQFEKYNQNPVINRIIDQQDLIPYACIDYLTGVDLYYKNTSIPKTGAVKENLFVNNAKNPYKTGIAHHFVGYLADKIWKNYDALGFEGAKNTITLKHSNFTYYDSLSFTNGKLSIFE